MKTKGGGIKVCWKKEEEEQEERKKKGWTRAGKEEREEDMKELMKKDLDEEDGGHEVVHEDGDKEKLDGGKIKEERKGRQTMK